MELIVFIISPISFFTFIIAGPLYTSSGSMKMKSMGLLSGASPSGRRDGMGLGDERRERMGGDEGTEGMG